MSEFERNTIEPNEQFVDALEQRLRDGIRRRALFDEPRATTRRFQWKGTRMLATASLMSLSLVLGATGTYAVVSHDVGAQRELLMQKASILLEQAQVRLDQKQTALAELLPLIEQGMAEEIVAVEYRQRVGEAVSELKCRELDLQETEITGRSPANDLTAPVIKGEDFVLQRLESQLQAVDLEYKLAQTEWERIEKLVGQGLISDGETIAGKADVQEAQWALARLQKRIELRKSFINGEIEAEEVELRALLREAEGDYDVAATRIKAMRLNLQRISALHEQGSATLSEIREAETAVREGESNLQLAEVQLEMLRRRLGEQ